MTKRHIAASFLLAASLAACGNPQSYYTVGASGPAGKDGVNGTSCLVTQIPIGDSVLPNGGAIIHCATNSVLISNGSNGHDGSNGTNGHDAPAAAFAITEVIDPCGDAPGIDDEVFLHLANGQLIWLQVDSASALTARLAKARDGSWQTTDGSACNFTISTTGNQRTIAWSGGGSTWTLN